MFFDVCVVFEYCRSCLGSGVARKGGRNNYSWEAGEPPMYCIEQLLSIFPNMLMANN